MSLRARLGLALSAISRAIKIAPQYVEDGFDVLLTQGEDAIITQSGIFIVRQLVQEEQFGVNLVTQSGDAVITQSGIFIVLQAEQYELITQDEITIITQDGRALQVGF